MKTIKELEAELPNPEGIITCWNNAQLQALKDVLGLIDEIDFSDCGRFVSNNLVREKLKKRINR